MGDTGGPEELEGDAALYVDTPEQRRARLRELVTLGTIYRTASDPVAAAFALAEFANEMTHLEWQLDDEDETLKK